MFLFVGLAKEPRIDEAHFGNLKKREGNHHNHNIAAPESPNYPVFGETGSWTQSDPRHVVHFLLALESLPAPPLSRRKLPLSPPMKAQQ